MCGFVGAISKNGKLLQENVLREMTSIITHRGPDDDGFYTNSDWLHMGFRRLSIIDLSVNGHQPMLACDGRYAIIYNGEVYNYKEIRDELRGFGYDFVSDSDTEVIVKAYHQWREACLNRFIGMFAFMIADLHERKVFIARDPIGIKPLYMYEDDDFFFFCSEIKSLLPYKRLEPDFQSLDEFLIFRYIVGRRTLFKNVKSLLPGHYLEYKDRKIVEKEYFHLSNTFKPEFSRSFEESCIETEQRLRESIALHLRSDVEVGVQLSGGVDSSLITAISSQLTGKKLHSFSISFSENEYDESEYQKRVSSRYNTEHHDYPLDEKSFCQYTPKAIWHFEHPLCDPSVVGTYYLTEQAKHHITVMLAGEGADETFLGYVRSTPATVKRLMYRRFFYQHPTLRNLLSKYWQFKKGKSFLNVTRYNPAMYSPSYADLNDVDSLIRGDDSGMEFRHQIESYAKGNLVDEILMQDQICDIAQWLCRADKMGMASSIEIRVPFCTVPMFSLANSIPYKLRVNGGERKAILKKIAEKYIDLDQIYRKKIGFGTPLEFWINKDTEFSHLYSDIIESKEFRGRDFINHTHFDEIYVLRKSGVNRERNCSFLWTYFNLELWYRIFFEEGWKKFFKNN